MKADKLKLYLPIIKALAEGKTLEYKNPIGNWVTVTGGLAFIRPPEYYRIKKTNMYSVGLFKDNNNIYYIQVLTNLEDLVNYTSLKEYYKNRNDFVKWLEEDKPIEI